MIAFRFCILGGRGFVMNEVVDAGTPEIEEKFVVKKWPVIVCMLVNMVLFVLPWFWYQKEAAINDAYGRENMDSFNAIPEFAAAMFLPLLVGIPLSLLYLLSLKGVHSEKKLFIIAFAPFAPWAIVYALVNALTFGVLLLMLLPCTMMSAAICGYAYLNMELINYCCCDKGKKTSLWLLLIGYIAVIAFGVPLGLYFWRG